MDSIGQLADKKADSHQKAVLHADIELIKKAIFTLKKDYQDVLIWYYLEDLPVEDIAQLVDKPAGTVRVMIHRGLEALKNQLHQTS